VETRKGTKTNRAGPGKGNAFPRAEVHSPPPGCAHGVANLDIVLEGSDVKRVRYECAQKPLEGEPGPAAGGGGAGTGLPPSVPSSGGSTGGTP
jgi:hypothetical protein